MADKSTYFKHCRTGYNAECEGAIEVVAHVPQGDIQAERKCFFCEDWR